MSPSTRWSELSGRQQAALIVLAPVEIVLTAIAARDLRQRPRDQVRGWKALWWPAIFVQPFGPVAYLLLGRRSSSDPSI